jgi:hypothetical protein
MFIVEKHMVARCNGPSLEPVCTISDELKSFPKRRYQSSTEKVMKKILLALLGCSICSYAFASSSVFGTVINVRVDSTGHGMVTFSATISGSPSCINSAAFGNAYAFDATTDGGRAFLALALASQASGAAISAVGLGTCNIYGGFAEDFYFGVNT